MAAKRMNEAETASHDVRDYIESMLDELADLARHAAEARVATILRHAALDISRLEPVA